MSWFDGQQDGKLHLWGIVPIRRPGEARRTAGRPGRRTTCFVHVVTGAIGGVHLMCCYWSSEPFSRASQPASPPSATTRKGQ